MKKNMLIFSMLLVIGFLVVWIFVIKPKQEKLDKKSNKINELKEQIDNMEQIEIKEIEEIKEQSPFIGTWTLVVQEDPPFLSSVKMDENNDMYIASVDRPFRVMFAKWDATENGMFCVSNPNQSDDNLECNKYKIITESRIEMEFDDKTKLQGEDPDIVVLNRNESSILKEMGIQDLCGCIELSNDMVIFMNKADDILAWSKTKKQLTNLVLECSLKFGVEKTSDLENCENWTREISNAIKKALSND